MFSSMLWFSLTAHWSMGSSSFALKLQTPETAHSEGTETEGNSGREFSFLPKSCFQQTASKTCFLELNYYRQVHKYWDIDTIQIFLALYTKQWIWNETNKMCFNCRLPSFNFRVFTSKSGQRCRNYNSLYMCLPLFKGLKVMGQLADQLFQGLVCVRYGHTNRVTRVRRV